MFQKFGIGVALLMAASPLAAQTPAQTPAAPPPPQPTEAQQAAIQQAGMAFGQCLSTGMQSVSASVTPEAGAAGVLSGCAAQRDALVKAVEAVIATLPADRKTAAQTQFDTRLGEAQSQIADAIRQKRAAPDTPPAPATPPH